MQGLPRNLLSVTGGDWGNAAVQVKRMKLRYAGVCRECAAELPAGTQAVYEIASKTVRCVECPGPAVPLAEAPTSEAATEVALDHLDGVAGSSARREHQRRKDAREERVRHSHPKLGGVILALSDDPQSARAWDVGAKGEQRLGRRFDTLAGPLVRVLHDRRIPSSRANIDHFVICSSGVFVIDAKLYKRRPHLRTEGGLLSPRTQKLVVGNRDCTRLVDGALKQAELVQHALDDPDTDVNSVLCFVEADWPLIGGDPHPRCLRDLAQGTGRSDQPTGTTRRAANGRDTAASHGGVPRGLTAHSFAACGAAVEQVLTEIADMLVRSGALGW